MIREWADSDTLDEIDQALTAPPSYRDPLTGLPLGFSEDDDTEFDDFLSQL